MGRLQVYGNIGLITSEEQLKAIEEAMKFIEIKPMTKRAFEDKAPTSFDPATKVSSIQKNVEDPKEELIQLESVKEATTPTYELDILWSSTWA